MRSDLWYRATLSAEQIATGQVASLRRLFAEAITGLIDDEGACLFATGDNTRTVTVFFSPASISAVPHLIAQYRAQPGSPPERMDAALLVGQPEDWDLLPHSAH
jgi:hypothetical protein